MVSISVKVNVSSVFPQFSRYCFNFENLSFSFGSSSISPTCTSALLSSLEKLLSNEKYIGVAVVNTGGEEGHIYKLNNAHQAIISKDVFDAVQKAKPERSNMVTDENGRHRNSMKYSSKKK
jgi:hypothetical protein